MLEEQLEEINKFRKKIHKSIYYRADSFMDLLDALCSNTTANTPVKLSLNPAYRRTYNSITDVVSEFHKGEKEQNDDMLEIIMKQAHKANVNRSYYLLGTDCTPAPRPHADTLTDRNIVYSPNAIAGNKPITIGHKYSTIGFLPPKEKGAPPWILPLMTQRVQSEQDDIILGAQQLQQILMNINQKDSHVLCVNVADSGYCKRKYIDALHAEDKNNHNLITVVRAQSNRVVYQKATEERSRYGNKRGHKLWYKDEFKFSDNTTWHETELIIQKNITTRKGKKCLVEIKSWSNMLMRQKNGIPMQKYPFTLCRITVADDKGDFIFHKPMWLMIFGERREEIDLWQAYTDYLQRYDLEHYFKFQKQHLLADKFQTVDTQHEENWWSICLVAYVMLFMARNVVDKLPYPWEKYLPEMNSKDATTTPSQVQRGFYELTRLIGTPALAPKPRGKSLGRQKGHFLIRRTRHPVIIKRPKSVKKTAA